MVRDVIIGDVMIGVYVDANVNSGNRFEEGWAFQRCNSLYMSSN